MTMPGGSKWGLRVVIPVHNAEEYVEESLKSVLADIPPQAEVVIVDDGSTDRSEQICRDFARSEPRVTLVRHEAALGVSRALNAGILHGRCPEFVAIQEHDDVVLPGRFNTQVSKLIEEPQLAAVASEGHYIGPSGRIYGRVASGPRSTQEFDKMRMNAVEMLIPHASVMYRTSAIAECGLYCPEFDGAQDLELFNRMVYEFGWEIRCLPDRHVLYRLHESASSFKSLVEQRMITRYIRYRNRCALEGRETASYRTWSTQHVPSRRTRWRWRRHDFGALNFRRAGLAWLERRRLRAAKLLLVATATHPQWVLQKVLKTVGR